MFEKLTFAQTSPPWNTMNLVLKNRGAIRKLSLHLMKHQLPRMCPCGNNFPCLGQITWVDTAMGTPTEVLLPGQSWSTPTKWCESFCGKKAMATYRFQKRPQNCGCLSGQGAPNWNCLRSAVTSTIQLKYCFQTLCVNATP